MAVTLRQVRLPLKIKLLALMVTMIALSLIVFVSIAIRIFKEDKMAYLFETLLNKATSEQLILSQKLKQTLPGDSSPSFELENGRIQLSGNNPSELFQKELTDEESIFDVKIIVPIQNDFYEWREGTFLPLKGDEKDILSTITTQSLHQTVKEMTLNNENIIYSFSYNPSLNFAYVVSLPQEKAYAVTSYLINKSLYYGLFILGLALVLSVLLARPLTRQLEKLFEMTQEIAGGNFQSRVSLKGHDEVGALSDSINHMADKIVAFMEEMKEKARLENEVAVAQLVQSSFFPQSEVSDPTFQTYGHFEPATECGGDWWGVADHDDWKIFFIADATGHGVPAALLTATINCCKSSLGFILETRPEMKSRPEEILRFMNQAVCGAGKEIQVTCFVACLNRRTMELVYANSSHTPPLLYSQGSGELTKDNFRPLIEANGPRLGQNSDATFKRETLTLKSCDTILFYTDGLTEAENPDGSRWGERRLLKSLMVNGQDKPEKIVNGVLSDFKEFTAGHPKNDDLTIVAMKVLA